MSSDVYTPAHGGDLHMSWCDGTHDRDTGACLLQVEVEDLAGSVLVSLVGEHCSHQRLNISGDVTSFAGYAHLLKALESMSKPMASGLVDVDCDAHPEVHQEPDDDDVPCDGCGTTTENMLRLSEGPPEVWLCRACCEDQGIPYGPRG